ncbi:lactonohydrolase [Lasiosphaeris hirsuta]|uniref:Lactonohydrolase n=1 Tax=Lasiosphaeris hirsuta TaxID=260670 RepID=A0AA40B1V0_9PEZI|nr:lactonohydrolase [Lasiosphaeris hirsuta]
MASLRSLATAAALFGHGVYAAVAPAKRAVPSLAQVINQKSFNVLPSVPTAEEYNASSAPWVPQNLTSAGLLDKPFHVYDDEFLDILGPNPTFTIIAQTPKDPIFHEAVVWYKPKDEVFFVQNAGNADAGTGLNKSAAIFKVSLKEVDAVKDSRNAVGKVTVTQIPSNPEIPNPNGATQYKGQLLYAAEGQGPKKAPALIILNPVAPYNTTVLLNNYFGRQFNSLNDITINPNNLDIYFTDPSYGESNNFRPAPGIIPQVYRYNDKTGAVTVAADGFVMPNGITFSPGGKYAYVTDTGIWRHGLELTNPSSIYRFTVQADGTFENRKTFAFVDTNIPDGVHTDSKGNVYAGVGDGVHVWNPSGKLLGKIYTGRTAANFQFVGGGRLIVAGETQLYYVTLAAEGNLVESQL